MKWRVYSYCASTDMYFTQSVEATSLENAKAAYELAGMYTFVWAEPLSSSPNRFDSSDSIKAWLRYNDVLDRVPPPVAKTAGPKKPTPAIPPEVWHKAPDVDTTDYMAAVRAMCGDES